MIQNTVKAWTASTPFGEQEGRYNTLDARRPDATPTRTAEDIPLTSDVFPYLRGGHEDLLSHHVNSREESRSSEAMC